MEINTSQVDDPLAPDAPLHHLLDLSHNPNVATMNEDELRALVQRLRTYATSPQSTTAKLQHDSDNVTSRKRNTLAAKRKAILDTL